MVYADAGSDEIGDSPGGSSARSASQVCIGVVQEDYDRIIAAAELSGVPAARIRGAAAASVRPIDPDGGSDAREGCRAIGGERLCCQYHLSRFEPAWRAGSGGHGRAEPGGSFVGRDGASGGSAGAE